MKKTYSRFIAGAVVCAGMTLASALTMADHIGMPGNMPKSYAAECASCHTQYAPGLLPAKSWHSIMNSLDKHYGSDASIDAKSVNEISSWLATNAASSRKLAETPPDNRITNSAWFTRKHSEIKKETWSRAAIKSRSNCMACHQQAAKGDFDENSVRIPR